jgi:hypothetical protein
MRTRAQAAADRRQLMREINRDHRRKAKETIASLRGQLREARQRRKLAIRDAKERCRAERIAARDRARALRLRVLEELREAMRAERGGARQACAVRLGEARSIKDDVQRSRAELLAERKYQADLRRVERANRQRRREAPRVTRIERQGESDDEVRANLPPELVSLFERVKRGIKASPRMSRTEALLILCPRRLCGPPRFARLLAAPTLVRPDRRSGPRSACARDTPPAGRRGA